VFARIGAVAAQSKEPIPIQEREKTPPLYPPGTIVTWTTGGQMFVGFEGYKAPIKPVQLQAVRRLAGHE
jgi:hypothetical protein